jgi:DnaJ domain
MSDVDLFDLFPGSRTLRTDAPKQLGIRILPIKNQPVYAIESPYNEDFVQALKLSISKVSDRVFDKEMRLWLFEQSHLPTVQHLVQRYFSVFIEPSDVSIEILPIPDRIRLYYLGRTKNISGLDLAKFASGHDGKYWSFNFPESVLKKYFAQDLVGQYETFYSILGIQGEADQEKIKSAWRAYSRTWHPDVCKEPDAAERFRSGNQAYKVLSDEGLRRKYDAGLWFEREALKAQEEQLRSINDNDMKFGYRSPYTCGVVSGLFVKVLNKRRCVEIYDWTEMKRLDGKVMVSSWPKGADSFVVEWYSDE